MLKPNTVWVTSLVLIGACGDDDARDPTVASAPTSLTQPGSSGDITTGDPLPTGTGDMTTLSGGQTDSGATGTSTTEATTDTDATTVDLTATGTTGTTDTTDAMTGTGTTSDTTGPPIDVCKVQDDMDAIGECDKQAPADSFDPEVQWQWNGANGEIYSVVTPLVANLTDDNNDGVIDLCDTPDVIAVAASSIGSAGHIYILDGATGVAHFQVPTPVDSTVTPVVGDIDGDGIPEIVSANSQGRLVAFEHDGTLKWTSAVAWGGSYIASLAMADFDNDGDVEIYGGNQIFDHLGAQVISVPGAVPNYSATVAADLDGDGDLELVIGHIATHHDGSMYYQSNLGPGYPQIANLDDDPEPEVLLLNAQGISVLEHNGVIKYQNLRPTGDPPNGLVWYRPATVHDLNGDGVSDFAVSSGNNYAGYRRDATLLWQATVSDQSGIAAGTAFDFLGDGIAEAMYADEKTMFIFDGATGQTVLQSPRSSATGTEYPIVADIDNDGSAEIVIVSNLYGGMASPTVQVIRDKQERWIQARRIWNQHAYHVTNVREDGTIPQFEPPSWTLLNTFRTNSQIEDGGSCKPPIPG